MQLKHAPEDFIVKEIISPPQGTGSHAYFWLTKRNYTLFQALDSLGRTWNVSRKAFGYAGMKDKRAVTTQLCSVKGVPAETIQRTRLSAIEVTPAGQGPEAIGLGDHKGNQFVITARDVRATHWRNPFINYFGTQRFGTQNVKIGRHLLQKKYQAAIALIDHPASHAHLKKQPTDYVGALQQLRKALLKLYIHAYQARLWNQIVHDYTEAYPDPDDTTLPLVGFATTYPHKEIERKYRDLLSEDGLCQRDFINKSLPALTAEGGQRAVWVEAQNLHHTQEGTMYRVNFYLPKGSYATVFLEQSLE